MTADLNTGSEVDLPDVAVSSSSSPSRRDRLVRQLPRLEDFPIPEQVRVDPKTWAPSMIEMADFIGPYHTLLICERFGGQQLKIPVAEHLSPMRAILGPNLSHVFTDIYQRNRLSIAVGGSAIRQARRPGVLASVRAGTITSADATMIIGTSRGYVLQLIRHTDEGVGIAPSPMPKPKEVVLLHRAADVVGHSLTGAGVADEVIQSTQAQVLAIDPFPPAPFGHEAQ